MIDADFWCRTDTIHDVISASSSCSQTAATRSRRSRPGVRRLAADALIGLVAVVALVFQVTGAAAEGPDIANFTLQNGLEVVVIPDHRTPVVTHMIWYKVGSADETPGKSGLAHFLEHLMFKG